MRNYEIMFIVRTTITEEEINAVVESFKKTLTDNGAKITDTTDMGKRELAYEINKYKTGHYFVLTVEASDDKAIKEFDRLALISQDIIRHLITKIEK